MRDTYKAAPGSDLAVEQGCICARIDNGYGRGYLGGMKDPATGETMFVVTVGCPVHSRPEDA
jgi:hypothetical protein